ncbi:MAG: hypothetical protein B7Z13_05065 [Caulobacterales bacterium 32-67-6]|nr:MAG: hypothetical protein B7Z13_05065 [Caulobacterales bacterium 32-67-6]
MLAPARGGSVGASRPGGTAPGLVRRPAAAGSARAWRPARPPSGSSPRRPAPSGPRPVEGRRPAGRRPG